MPNPFFEVSASLQYTLERFADSCMIYAKSYQRWVELEEKKYRDRIEAEKHYQEQLQWQFQPHAGVEKQK